MENSKRVLFHAFSTFKLGGPQARFVQLANAFGSEYHHIVAAMDNCFEAGDRLDPNVSWKPLPLLVRRGGALANRVEFRQVLKAQRPDMLLTYNWGAIEWAAANIPRCIRHVHIEDGFGPEEVARQLPRRVWMRRVLLGLPRVPLVVPSRKLEKIASQVWRLSPQRVRFVANGVAIDVATLTERAIRQACPHVLTIGTVAGLRPEKNISRLIKAFAKIRASQPARLVVVGGGAEQVALQDLAFQLGIAADVEFTGYLSNPLSRLIDFDLFALSSDTEQLPIAMLEAMACGIPVVATKVGDVADVMPLEAQRALSAPTDESFAATLQDCISQKNEWKAWSLAGQEVVKKWYSLEGMLSEWKLVFNGLYR